MMDSETHRPRHLSTVRPVRLVPVHRSYSPSGRAGLVPAPGFVARHAATATGVTAVVGIAGSSAAAVALMLGLGR